MIDETINAHNEKTRISVLVIRVLYGLELIVQLVNAFPQRQVSTLNRNN